MPRMNGRDCFARLRALRPDVRVVLSSGFLRDEDLLGMRADGLRGYIRKPYRASELSRVLRDALLPP